MYSRGFPSGEISYLEMEDFEFKFHENAIVRARHTSSVYELTTYLYELRQVFCVKLTLILL